MNEYITIEEIIDTFKRSHNWTSPGVDKITNFWLCHLSPH